MSADETARAPARSNDTACLNILTIAGLIFGKVCVKIEQQRICDSFPFVLEKKIGVEGGEIIRIKNIASSVGIVRLGVFPSETVLVVFVLFLMIRCECIGCLECHYLFKKPAPASLVIYCEVI